MQFWILFAFNKIRNIVSVQFYMPHKHNIELCKTLAIVPIKQSFMRLLCQIHTFKFMDAHIRVIRQIIEHLCVLWFLKFRPHETSADKNAEVTKTASDPGKNNQIRYHTLVTRLQSRWEIERGKHRERQRRKEWDKKRER